MSIVILKHTAKSHFFCKTCRKFLQPIFVPSRQTKYFLSESYSLTHSICTNTLKVLYFPCKPTASTS